MSRKPSSSLSSASFSKQQSSSTTTNGTRKLKILRQMISELQKEKKEYEKTNQHLMQSTQMIYEENKILTDAIESRKIYFDKLPDRILQSEKTVQKQFELNQKMSRIYHSYKNKFNDAEKTGKKAKNDSEDEAKKIDLKIDDIEKSAKILISNFSESEKKVNYYKILLSLYSKLININNLLTKQAKNCFFKSTKLQKKIENGNAIKKKLFMSNDKEEEEKINTTKYVLNDITNDLDRCLSIYSQIFLISKKRMLMSKDNFDDDSKYTNENFVYRKIFSFDDEIEELSRIVGAKKFDYLNGTECEEKYRRFQNLFAHGQYPIYDSEESTDSEKENDEYLESEQPEQNLEEESEEDEENDREIQKEESEDDEENDREIQKEESNDKIEQLENENVSKQEPNKKKVKYRKKHMKRQMKLKNLKILKQDVSVQARMSIGLMTAKKQQQEKIEATTQVSGNLSQSKKQDAKQCKYTIGNELIMEFLLKELVGESNKEINESINDDEKTEKDNDVQVSKNVLKPFFTNPGEFLLEDLEGETDDESDRKNNLEFYSDSYNLDESTNSAYFEVEEQPQSLYNESNKKYTLENKFLFEISFGGDESDKVNNMIEYVNNAEQEKEEEIEKASKYCQQFEAKSKPKPKPTEEIASKYQISKIEPQSVNNKAKDTEKIRQTKPVQTILTNTKSIPKKKEEDTASKNQLNRLEKACKSNQTEKVNNDKMNAKTEKLIKTIKSKDRPQINAKPNIKDAEEDEEEEETEFESLSEKTKQARIPFSQLIHILKGMQQPDIQMDEKATEKCSSFECLPKKIDEDPRKASKTEKSISKNIPEQKTDLELKQKDQPEIAKELFSLLDLEDFSEAPKSPKEFIEAQKSEPTTITTKSNQSEQPKQIKLQQQLSSNVPRSITINSSKNQSLNETKLNLKETKVDNAKTEKANNVNQPENVQHIELNTKAKQPKKAKQTKASRSFFVHKVKDRKQPETKPRSQSPEKENDSEDELEKARQTRIPLTQLVDVLKALHQSGVKIGENEAEESKILEYLSSETEGESEKAIKTEKFILGKIPELTTSSESEQQEKAETLSLLDLEEFSEAPKTPKENKITNLNTKFEQPKLSVDSKQTKLSQQTSKSPTLSKTLPSSDIKPSPKSIEEIKSEYQLNGLEKTCDLNLPEKVENEKVNVKTEKSVITKKAQKPPSKSIHPPKDRLSIKRTEDEADSEHQLNEFETYSEKTKQARIPLSQLVDFLKALHRSGVKIGENETEESNELEYLTSETEEESEKAIKTEKFILGKIPELTTSSESEHPEKFELTTTSRPNQSEQQKHAVRLPKGSPQLSARQNQYSKEKRDASDNLTSETEDESEKAIKTEKFILGKIPELTTSSESEQQEKAETLSLLDLEEFSEAPKTPKENKQTHKFEQSKITKSNQLEQLKQANASRPISNNTSSSLLVHQHTERPQSEVKIYKLKIEEEPNSDPKSTQKEETNQNLIDKKASKKFPVHPPKAKKPARESTYDRSIFYTPMNTLSSLDDDEYSNNNNNKVQITVTLKDIGLEGLDSFKPEKTSKINNRETTKNENSKKTVCKFDLFTAPSTARKGRPASASSNVKSKTKTNTKQASLLDSTQKAQKYQAIKPKTTPKYTSKYNENNRTNAGNHINQINKCSQEDRSPKRFYNEMTERLPTVLNYNYAVPI